VYPERAWPQQRAMAPAEPAPRTALIAEMARPGKELGLIVEKSQLLPETVFELPKLVAAAKLAAEFARKEMPRGKGAPTARAALALPFLRFAKLRRCKEIYAELP